MKMAAVLSSTEKQRQHESFLPLIAATCIDYAKALPTSSTQSDDTAKTRSACEWCCNDLHVFWSWLFRLAFIPGEEPLSPHRQARQSLPDFQRGCDCFAGALTPPRSTAGCRNLT
ncbi:hypothetical protein AAFF_G00390460 [Aldrovandia affinis]|uniref:Uncharacterized protein n=1 Tax=Aldrovandia affinis TaxID=143900 RepID=A0AAD7SEP4_9TELE|nr:hypothetical protein AAFF_G00390460 [Aldrovandia affinis]